MIEIKEIVMVKILTLKQSYIKKITFIIFVYLK